jgi:hypothetical protein
MFSCLLSLRRFDEQSSFLAVFNRKKEIGSVCYVVVTASLLSHARNTPTRIFSLSFPFRNTSQTFLKDRDGHTFEQRTDVHAEFLDFLESDERTISARKIDGGREQRSSSGPHG